MRKLPPLNGLASFEAAARHLNFTAAARELNVTQSAISHQIKTLESVLDAQLFIRHPRKLSLTTAGRLLLPVLTDSFNHISTAIDQVRQIEENKANTLSVRVAPSFALAWISPRLGEFWRTHPNIELCLYHSHSPTNFNEEDIDVAVSYGKGDWPNVVSELLLKLDFFPVCSPSLIEKNGGSIALEDFENFNLLHEVDHECWLRWINIAGLEGLNPFEGSIIDDTNVLTQAAVDGQGIALGSSIFVDHHLQSGKLVRLSEVSMENEDGYYLVYPKEALNSPLVNSFREWILSKV